MTLPTTNHDYDSDVTADNRPVSQYNDDLTTLISCLFTAFGPVIGQAITDKLDQVVALGDIDIAALQSQLDALNQALAANTSGDALSAQNLLSAIAAIGNRVTTLEGSTAIATLTADLATLQTALNQEVTARQDADSQLQAQINTLQSQYDQLNQSLVTIQNQIDSGTGNACDCAALQEQISTLSSAVTELQGVDSQTTTLINGLRTRIETLEVAATTASNDIATALAAAQNANSTAQSALSTAATAQATANSAAQTAANAQAAITALEAANTRHHGHFVTKAEVMDINCEAVIAAARVSLRNSMGLAL